MKTNLMTNETGRDRCCRKYAEYYKWNRTHSTNFNTWNECPYCGREFIKEHPCEEVKEVRNEQG